MTTYKPKQIGCNTHVPLAWASKPVTNGATAPPELPAELMNATAVFCSERGRRRAKMLVAQGKIGPRSRPISATEIASPTTLGTRQTDALGQLLTVK